MPCYGRVFKPILYLSINSEGLAKLEWTQSYAQQNIEQLCNPTMEVTIKN